MDDLWRVGRSHATPANGASTPDGLVFSKVRERFGGRLKYAFSGGAAISKEVAEFIDNLGITVYEGYGLSETSPIATANYPGARKIGSVGKPIPGVEIEMKLSPYISNAMVCGMNREYNVAVVIPDYEALKGWAAEKGLDTDPASLAKSGEVRALIEEEVNKFSAEFKGYERARKIFVGDEDFTTDNGMLTPTLKLKRRVVLQRYNDAIESLYA